MIFYATDIREYFYQCRIWGRSLHRCSPWSPYQSLIYKRHKRNNNQSKTFHRGLSVQTQWTCPHCWGLCTRCKGPWDLRFAWIVGNQNCAETYPNHRRSRVGRSLCPSNCCCSPRLETTFDVRKIWDCHLVWWQRKMVSDCSLGCFSSRQWPAQKETRRQSKSHSLFLWCRHSPWTKQNLLLLENIVQSCLYGSQKINLPPCSQ